MAAKVFPRMDVGEMHLDDLRLRAPDRVLSAIEVCV